MNYLKAAECLAQFKTTNRSIESLIKQLHDEVNQFESFLKESRQMFAGSSKSSSLLNK